MGFCLRILVLVGTFNPTSVVKGLLDVFSAFQYQYPIGHFDGFPADNVGGDAVSLISYDVTKSCWFSVCFYRQRTSSHISI